MKSDILLEIPGPVYKAIQRHLLPRSFLGEEAAFIYVHQDPQNKTAPFQYIEWIPVPPSGFLFRSRFHFELTDEMRGAVIKRAHDLGVSLVEFHSHWGNGPAEFSVSDLAGFRDFVPHVFWRLKGRPYLALVLCRSGFDGLAWVSNPKFPQRLDGLIVDKLRLAPTKLSQFWEQSYGNGTV